MALHASPRDASTRGAVLVALAVAALACGGTGAADAGSASSGPAAGASAAGHGGKAGHGGHAGTTNATGGAAGSFGVGAGGGSGGAAPTCQTMTPDPGNDDQSGCTCAPPAKRDCYNGEPAKAGVGVCKHGTQICTTVSSGEISAMQWSPCMGAGFPGVETCNGLDDDCNGVVDDGCCTGPITCTTADGKPGTAGCAKGVQGPCVAMPCTSPQECEQSSCCATPYCVSMGKACCTGPSGGTTAAGEPGSADCVNGVAQPCKPLTFSPCPNPNDCNNPACCLSPICAANGSACDPGGCGVGQIRDPVAHVCRDCQAADCNLVPALCCAAPVCKGATWCSAYLCGGIDGSCGGKTSGCNQGDLDADDSFGDCDEAFNDPCCPCKVAVGCGFGSTSLCGYGQVVKNNACAACTAGDCKLPPCMGLNGCPTNCPPGQFFNGAACEMCFPFLSMNIPACK